MLAELVTKLLTVGRDSDRARITPVDGVDSFVLLERGGGTAAEKLDLPPPRRRHQADGLADLVAMVQKHGTSPMVLCDHKSVVGVFDAEERRDFVVMAMKGTQRFGELMKLQQGMLLSPRDAVRKLRFDLHGTNSDTVRAALESVDFSRKGTSTSRTTHVGESLGRDVESSVQARGEIPEHFDVDVPVFANPGTRSFTEKVRVGVHVDCEQERIEFRVLMDEIDGAITRCTQRVAEALRDLLGSVPVYHGRL